MIDQYVFNEMNNIAANSRTLLFDMELAEYQNAVIICDDSFCAYYLCAGLAILKGKAESSESLFPNIKLVLEGEIKNKDYLDYIRQSIGFTDIYNSFDEYKKSNTFDGINIYFRFVDLKNKKYDSVELQKKTLENTDLYLSYASQNKDSVFVLTSIIPDIDKLPNDVLGISEREYEVVFFEKPESSREKFLIKLEDIARKYVDELQLNALTTDNIIAPDFPGVDAFMLNSVLQELKDNKSITVYTNDNKEYYSAVYITHACLAMINTALHGRRGNIYNVSAWHFTKYEIKSILYSLFSFLDVKLKTDYSEIATSNEYHILNPKKMLFINTPPINRRLNVYNLKYALNMTALSYIGDNEHFETEPINVYYGKIDKIRQLELETLIEVDKICREHNIKYFLAGGTMLGAVRHKGFIPWDDDVDIAMLPGEYEKFLKVCPENLSVERFYQTTNLEPESLYIHDKIRLKGTYFSTRYSNQFTMENGVYIDVFIYYKTSKSPRKQAKHIRQIHIMRRLLGMRWVNYPRSNIHYTLSKIALPFMRLFSTKTFKKWYIRLISKYEKKNTGYLLDATGLNLEKVAAFPEEWFHDFVDGEFEGHKFPILKRYDDYLRHWYGENYMQLLPISSRTSVHDVIRIDLGKYIVPTGKDYKGLHVVDLRGELYEKYGE